VALILVSAQPTQVAALSNPQSSYSLYYHHRGYWGGYWGSYWWTYPYYYYYYPYYSSSYCPSNSNYYSYPYYYGYYSGYYCSPSSYTLTVSTDPSSLGTVTGGGSYTSGSSASFSVSQNIVQVSPNTRYVFDHWSGDYSGVGTSGTVTMNNAMTITAEYKLQYSLTVSSQPQNAPTPQGSGWYNAGDTATVQNGGQTTGDAASRLVFQGWSVDGQALQSGSTLGVVMNAPHNVNAVYEQQYYLNVQTDQGVALGSGWYDAGSTAQISVSTPVSTTYGISIVFNGWQGDVQSSSQSTSVVMNGPKNVAATWRTDATVLYLTIAAIVVAAVLIVAGVVAFMVRGRYNMQAPPPQPPAPALIPPQNSVQHTESNTAHAMHKTEHHRRKTTAEDTEQPSEPTVAA
jgi:hypothetical protein